jgi:hypothetical protein
MPVEPVVPAIVWLASDRCSQTNRIHHVEPGAIQRISIVMGSGFYDPHLPHRLMRWKAEVVRLRSGHRR